MSNTILRVKHRMAKLLVRAANTLVNNMDTPSPKPYYRPVDTHMPGIGHQHSCGAYSYEFLESLVEQDGPDGFGATATIKWLLSDEGWVSLENMPLADIKATFAADGTFDLSPPIQKMIRKPDINDCARCDGDGLDPDGPNKGMYRTKYCRRCAGSGKREDGPT